MLKHRIMTSVVLLAALLAVLFLLPIPALQIVIVGVIALASWEWSTLCGVQTFHNKVIVLLLTGGVLWLAHYQPWLSLLATLAWWLIVFGKLSAFSRLRPWLLGRTALLALTSVPTLAGFGIGLFVLLMRPYPQWQILFCLTLTFAADLGGYFIGKQWGTIAIAPQLSPNKTLQGLIGSLLFSGLLGLAVGLWLKMPNHELVVWMLFVALLVLFALVGDLFESMIKRTVGAKDSGTLLPGHGGLLDRLDSLAATVPLFALLSVWYGEHFI